MKIYIAPNGTLKKKYKKKFHKPIHGVNENGFYTDPAWVDSYQGIKLKRDRNEN